MIAEKQRLDEAERRVANWKRWGPYLSERQWGTVREDYSENGDPWNYFPHDQARSRAYRWGEDGLLGITDRECRLCFALALWNGKDAILKERLYGLNNHEGNHGEDVKECYFYLDSTPTHSYMKALYKYPQAAFPYDQLLAENARRDRTTLEFDLADTGIFDRSEYFDVYAEYAKGAPDDILIRVTIHNRSDMPAQLHLLPTIWARNTWTWGCKHEGCWIKASIRPAGELRLQADHVSLGRYQMDFSPAPDGSKPDFLFTENETNSGKLFGASDSPPHSKDAFHEYVVNGRADAVNPANHGTKAAAHYRLVVPPRESVVLRFRLYNVDDAPADPLRDEFEKVFEQRILEANEFYDSVIPEQVTDAERAVMWQSYAGLLWSKQFYHYVVDDWLEGDPEMPPPPESRKSRRNADWPHLFNRDVISMPDKWEYPWYAAWDTAYHMIPFARIDPDFAKSQLLLLLREWYMHPNGQIPAYEYDFSDVNPPVHAWACWRVYKMSAPRGQRDLTFLRRVFHKLIINFTWWVNRKDPQGRHIFSGGFLGLDNIGVFDRSAPVPSGGHLEQADGTAWMAFYCLTMIEIALELAAEDPAYQDVASKFFEHFVGIIDAMNHLGGNGLWDEEDGFYYDEILHENRATPIRVRSIVGLIPLFAVTALEQSVIDKLPEFKKRMTWFLENRKDLARLISYVETDEGVGEKKRLLAVPSRDRLRRVLGYMLDENEFLSPYGIRSLSKIHEEHPYVFESGAARYTVKYVPGESDTAMFGGNSNWRGPIWFPINYLLVEALERYHYFYGDDFKVDFPTGSGNLLNLKQIARELATRLASIFLQDEKGRRPVHGAEARFAEDPHWRDLVLFYEYFHGDSGRGLGASHQTGWTALISRFLEDQAKTR